VPGFFAREFFPEGFFQSEYWGPGEAVPPAPPPSLDGGGVRADLRAASERRRRRRAWLAALAIALAEADEP
jgi:hypothetical protein